jgi:hypothetical protein
MKQTEKIYHDNGQIKEEFETLDNKLDGFYKFYHENGQLRAETNYKKGKQLDQIINSFDENGNLIRTVEFKKGFLTGPFVEYFSTGEIKLEGVYKKNKIHKGSQKVYLKNGDIVENKVNTFEEFKNLYKYYISNFLFDDFDTSNIIIGIPKFSIYTEVLIEGIFENYKFEGVLHEICKWLDYDFYYTSHNDFYNDLLEISNDKLNFDFLDDLASIGNFEYGAPGEGLEIINVNFEDSTPSNIKTKFYNTVDEYNIEDYSTTGFNYGDTIYSEIAYFKMDLINSQYGYNFEIVWENKDKIKKKSNVNIIDDNNDLSKHEKQIEEYSDTLVNLISDLIKEGKEEEAFSLFVELNQISTKSEIKNRIFNSNIDSDDFLKFLFDTKSFIFVSTLSENVKNKLLEIIIYLENDYVFNDNIDKLIDIVFYFENDYNDEIYVSFSETNFLEGLQHAQIIKKFLSYFVDESRSSVCDTLAYLLLLNDKLPEAEKEILKCLQIDINSDSEIPVHYITAAKIFYKKNDLINGLKYYEKAIESGAEDDSIIELEQFLYDNKIKI